MSASVCRAVLKNQHSLGGLRNKCISSHSGAGGPRGRCRRVGFSRGRCPWLRLHTFSLCPHMLLCVHSPGVRLSPIWIPGLWVRVPPAWPYLNLLKDPMSTLAILGIRASYESLRGDGHNQSTTVFPCPCLLHRHRICRYSITVSLSTAMGRCLPGWVRCGRWAGGSVSTSKASGPREQPTSEPERNCVLSIFVIIYSYSIFMYIILDDISNYAYLIILFMLTLIEVAETDFYGKKVT